VAEGIIHFREGNFQERRRRLLKSFLEKICREDGGEFSQVDRLHLSILQRP
jgi:hypothetical protein